MKIPPEEVVAYTKSMVTACLSADPDLIESMALQSPDPLVVMAMGDLLATFVRQRALDAGLDPLQFWQGVLTQAAAA